jgi:hypothetical protein
MTKKSLLIVLGILAVTSARGQYYSTPTRIPMTMKTPYGNVTTYVAGPPMYYYYGGQVQISHKYNFTIVWKDGKMTDTKSRINLTEKKEEDHSLSLKTPDGIRMVYPSDTRAITRITSEGKQLYGIAADSCWLFKTATGKINSYSFIAELNTTYVTAIQKGEDGPILPLTKDNLVAIVGTDNPKLNKLVSKGKLLKAVHQYNKVDL